MYMKRYFINKIKGTHLCYNCHSEAKISSKFYDFKGIERQFYYCYDCILGGKHYEYPLTLVISDDLNKLCQKCDDKAHIQINNNTFFCFKHLTK